MFKVLIECAAHLSLKALNGMNLFDAHDCSLSEAKIVVEDILRGTSQFVMFFSSSFFHFIHFLFTLFLISTYFCTIETPHYTTPPTKLQSVARCSYPGNGCNVTDATCSFVLSQYLFTRHYSRACGA